MNKISNKLKQSFVLFLMFTMILAMFPGAVGADVPTRDVGSLIEETIHNTIEYMYDEGVYSDWQAIGLHQAGSHVPESYHQQFYNQLKSQIVDSDSLVITHAARLTLVAQAIGLNPTNINEENLIQKMYESDGIGRQTNNAPIYALIAFDSGSFSIPDDAKWTREKTVKRILDLQNEDDGWALFGNQSNVDMTAMALTALSNHKETEGVSESVERAISFLSEQQTQEGGFFDKWNGGLSSEATAQVIIALTSLGIDPTSEAFTKEEGNLMDHLLSFISEDKGFKHLPSDKISNPMATEQALQALVAYQKYITDGSKLYDFGTQEEVEPQPDPEPQPDVEDKIEIEVGNEVNVLSGQIVTIKDSKTSITLPEGLPDETKLTISEPSEKTSPYKDSNLKRAGDWFDFTFQGTQDFQGTYELTLGIDEEADMNEADVYSFNEEAQDWELIEGDRNHENHTITVMVDHFSVYGVFTEVVTEDDQESDEEEQEQDEETPENTDNDEPPVENEDGDLSTDETMIDTDQNIDQTESEKTVHTNPKVNKVKNKDVAVPTAERENGDGEKLPKTASNTYNFMIAGILILALGIILLGIRKKVGVESKE